MSSLQMVEAKLPPGFRFHPRDDELVCDYLLKKWNSSDSLLLIEVDLNKCEPWDIPETACVGGKEWYFYSQRDRKYATGLRTNRATTSGYWKATGKDRAVIRKGNLVGMRKTLVFYQGRAPKGKKTDWVMHEYRVEGPFGPPKTSTSKDWVLCRVFYKNKDEVASRSSNMENESSSCYDETTASSISLPPLTDSSYISFEQTDHPNTDSYQQVPCFSNYSPNTQNNPTFPSHNNNIFQLDPISNISNNSNTKNYTNHPTTTTTIIPNVLAPNPPLACDHHDKKVIEAVLSHLTKMENSPTLKGSPSLGEAASASNSESYLSEVALPPNLWSHY